MIRFQADADLNQGILLATILRLPVLDFRKKVLSHYKVMGMGADFRYDPRHDEYFETGDYEDRSPHMAAIDAYEERVFWENLASKLGRRDLAAEEALRAEPRDEEQRSLRLFELIRRYEEELAEKGLDNLHVDIRATLSH